MRSIHLDRVPLEHFVDRVSGFITINGNQATTLVEITGIRQREDQIVLTLGNRAVWCRARKAWQPTAPSAVREIPVISKRGVERWPQGALGITVCCTAAAQAGLDTQFLYIRTDPEKGILIFPSTADTPQAVPFPNMSAFFATDLTDT